MPLASLLRMCYKPGHDPEPLLPLELMGERSPCLGNKGMTSRKEKLQKVVQKIKPLDRQWLDRAQQHLSRQARPLGSLGRLEELAARLVAIQETLTPSLERRVVLVMAGDHGVAAEGVSAFSSEVTRQMVANFIQRGAAINVLAEGFGAKVFVVDMGVAADLPKHPGLLHQKVALGTRNLAREPAMTREEALQAVLGGVEAFEAVGREGGNDILLTGDMGIANTTPSSAICAAVLGCAAAEVTGRGTGIDDAGLQRKIAVIERALSLHRPDPREPLDILRKVGGFEIGGICGAILAAAAAGTPVLVDGLVSTAGLLLACLFSERVKEYVFAAHLSEERAHGRALAYLGLEPILDLRMRLGEGTGAALALPILDAALRIFQQVAPFEEAQVTVGREKDRK